ncbi:coenzyme F420 hydrogenase subunit beta [Methanophagales archaeon]|nr:coenzyme F420 hydrogenase subunit beta [Methanophagales archaeon]
MPAYEELESEVIEKGLCTYCGACIASCPLFYLRWIDGRPKRPEKKAACVDCEVCYHACHRTAFDVGTIEGEIFGRRRREDDDIGIYRHVIAAKAKDEKIHEKAQDSGVVTAILLYLLEEELIDGAIVTGRGEEWLPSPMVAKSREEILSAAGTKYGISPNLMKVRTAVIEEELDNICIVGLPCHVRAVRHLQHINFELAPAIRFVIGLFCHKNFEYARMSAGIAKRGVKMGEIEKISISKGFFHVHTGDTKVSIPLKETTEWHSKHCLACDDYSAEQADISVGSEGTKEGWSSVILRTEKGEKVFSELEAKGYVRTKEIDDFVTIKRNSMRKRRTR